MITYYFQFLDDDRFWYKHYEFISWMTRLHHHVGEAERVWVEEDSGFVKQIKDKTKALSADVDPKEFKNIKETSWSLDMITIIQRTDGTVQLNFPYSVYKSQPTTQQQSHIPEGMEEWLTENTDAKWVYGKWMVDHDARKIGAEITREDLVALKLKFQL